MAIYTQFGRYEKARQFKHWVETEGEVYMLLGFGNPRWDSIDSTDTSQQYKMPIAPYNTSIINHKDYDGSDPLAHNQFYDDSANMSFLQINNEDVSSERALSGSNAADTSTGKYIDKCKNLIPPFPCWWSVGKGSMTFIAKNAGDSMNGVAIVVTENDGKYSLEVGGQQYAENVSDFYNLEKNRPDCPVIYSGTGINPFASSLQLSGGANAIPSSVNFTNGNNTITVTFKEGGASNNGSTVTITEDQATSGVFNLELTVSGVTTTYNDITNLEASCPVTCNRTGTLFTDTGTTSGGQDAIAATATETTSGHNNTIEFGTGVEVDLDEYDKYYITKDDDNYILHSLVDSGSSTQINFPTGDNIEDVKKRQYFSELYLRGLTKGKGIYHPVCLLGAVKCNVDFVRDIGQNESVYTGELNQFWYGDRYWEVVDINEGDEINSYIDDENGKSILPCHLAFTVTIPPMFLCDDMKIDQNLSPRQIAIFTRKRKKVNNSYESGPNYYRAYENIFNFGQYYKVDNQSDFTPTLPNDIKMLNFTLPCNITFNNETHVYPYSTDGTDFKFLLGDYLRGTIKNNHTAERIGYVVGF